MQTFTWVVGKRKKKKRGGGKSREGENMMHLPHDIINSEKL